MCCRVHFCRSSLGFVLCSFGFASSPFLLCVRLHVLIGLGGPYTCLVCPPANIGTNVISCFVVSCLCVVRVKHDRIPTRNDHLFTPQAPFSWLNMSLGPKVHMTTHKCPPGAPITIPNPLLQTVYVVVCFEEFWHVLYRACVHVLCVCLRVLGRSASMLVLTLTLST